MGPAILFCPSSSAVHLWVQIVPLKKARHREGSIALPNGVPRCLANTDLTGVSRRRQALWFNPATSSENYRQPTYPFEWRQALPAAAAGGEVSVEEAAVAGIEAPVEEGLASEPSNEKAPVATERKTPLRRSLSRSNSNANKSVVVSPAELIPGATFPGKVITIQTFGAFVDLGAFTNGLIHISRLSKSYVKKVEDVVQVGQDVNVQVLEFDSQANRISLMLVEEGKAREEEAEEKQTQTSSQQQARPSRRDSSKRPPNSQRQPVTTTMKKDEITAGTVKNIIRSGVFLTLPDGTDGYLPAAEVIFKGPNTNMDSQFQVGQEVTVRVLRIDKGRVNLTMRREVNYEKLNEDLNKGVVDGAANPFEIAFRNNELIASFLADRDKQKEQAEANEKTTEEDEAISPVEEVNDVASDEKPAVEEEKHGASGVDAVTDETTSSAVVDPAEEVKELKLAVVQEEDAADGVGGQNIVGIHEEIKEDESTISVEEAEDKTLVAEKPAVEEVKDVAIGVNGRKDGEDVASEPTNAVGVKDVVAAEKQVAEERKDVAVGIGSREDVHISPEAVKSVGEVKDLMPVVEKPTNEEEKGMAISFDARKDEGVSAEAVNTSEGAKDGAEEENPAEEKEEEAVSGIDAAKEAEKSVAEAEEVAVRSVS